MSNIMNNLDVVCTGESQVLNAVPQALKEIAQWVMWKYQERNGKETKPPFTTKNTFASVSDSSTWSSFQEVTETLNNSNGTYEGVGIVMTPDLGIVAIDVDDCLDYTDDGKVFTPEALDIMRLAHSYTELSPSGCGIRIFVRGVKKGPESKTGHYEMYDRNHYLTVTGNWFDGGKDIVENQDGLDAIYDKYLVKQPTLNPPVPTTDTDIPEVNDKVNDKVNDEVDTPIDIVWTGPKLTTDQCVNVLLSMKTKDKVRALLAGDQKKIATFTPDGLFNWSVSDFDWLTAAWLMTDDPKQVEEIWRQSKLSHRDKFNREDYRERTIENARPKIRNAKNRFRFGELDGVEVSVSTGGGEGEGETQEFWYQEANKSGKLVWKVNPFKLTSFLASEGFGYLILSEASPNENVLVRVDPASIVEETTIARARQFGLNYLLSRVSDKVARAELTKSYKTVVGLPIGVNEVQLGLNPYFATYQYDGRSVILDFLKDTKDAAFFPFRNGVVETTKEGVQLISKGQHAVWKSQIIDLDFTPVSDNTIINFDFYRFLKNLCTDKTSGVFEEERFLSLLCSIGYLLHDFKNSANRIALVLSEASLDDDPQGRTGKGLIMQAVGKLRKTCVLDGRNFSFDSQFCFGQYTPDTKILFFDDVKAKFDFRRLYSVITEGLSYEQKGKDRLSVSASESPKVSLSTNYALLGNSESDQGRRYEMELLNYYSSKHTPIKDFGRLFFDDWTSEDWNIFYNLMFSCVHRYLSEDKIPVYHSEVIEEKRLKQETSTEFVEWADDTIKPENEYQVLTLVQEMANIEPLGRWNQTSMAKAIKKWSVVRQLEIKKFRKADNCGKKATFILVSQSVNN